MSILGVNSSLRKAKDYILAARLDFLGAHPGAVIAYGEKSPENTAIRYTDAAGREACVNLTAIRFEEDMPFGQSPSVW